MDENHFKKLEKMYLNANINTSMYESTAIQIQREQATISITIEEKYFHALGAIHGSVYFKLLDDAAFFAVNSIVDDAFVLTTSFNLNIIRPASAGIVKSVGRVKYNSAKLYVAESVLYDDRGREIAFGIGNFVKSKVALSEEIGYQL